MSELQAVTGQLYIVDGVMQTGSAAASVPGILVQPPPNRAHRSRSRDFLFAHLTLSGNVEETAVLAQDLLDLISQKFYATSGSLTAALRGAIMNANQTLLQRNLTSKETFREGGLTCAVLRQGELFTLQVGESLALLGHNFGIERLPPRPLDHNHITPLGRTSGLDIRYAHHRLQSGDLLLLADPRLSHLPTDSFSDALVDTDIETGLDTLIDVVADESARLLLLEFNDHSLLDLPDVVQPMPRQGQSVAPAPQPRRSPETAPVPVSSERRPQPVREGPPDPARDGIRSLPAIDRQQVETTARRAGSQAALGLSTFTAWLADLLSRLRPPRTAVPTEEEEPISWTWPVIIAVLIPVLLAVIVSGVYLERGRVQRLSEIRTEMAQLIGLADEAGSNAPLARQHYNTALALAIEAETEVRPGDEEVARLRTIARERLDVLDDVTRLAARPFYAFSEGTSLTHVVLRDGFNGGIFILDKGNGLVYEYETDETYLNPLTLEPQTRVFNGQAVGSGVAGSVIDMFWRPAGNAVSRDGLAMLDSNGALLTYQPSLGSVFGVPLDLSSEWQAPIAIATFNERIYILDIGAQVIWKYFPIGDDFTANADDRTLFFAEDAELNQVIDFDIFNQDGGLVLLYRDGRIRYYDTRSSRLVWDESDLLTNGLQTPLLAPTAVEIVGRGLNASIFVADPGSGRIVQISRPTGQVLAQYRATGPNGEELFSQITDFAIAETPLRIFITTEATLYLAVQE